MKYEDVAHKMKPGDVIAFSSYGGFSDVIRDVTQANVTHVGVMLENAVDFNTVIESATIKDFCGVSVNLMRERIEEYHGEIWWLPLDRDVRKNFKFEPFWEFLISQKGKHYDIEQALLAGLKYWLGIGDNEEDFSNFYCSEIVVAGLKKGEVIPQSINASETTPIDVCNFGIYDGVHQLKGKPKGLLYNGHTDMFEQDY